MELKNKIALITGGASGIGKEIALEFAKQGAKVCVADLSIDAAVQTAKQINLSGGTAIAIAMDVTDENQVDNTVAEVMAQFGSINILISNKIKLIIHIQSFGVTTLNAKSISWVEFK